jgi:hypothetical protein
VNWIRIAVGIMDDPKAQQLADALSVKLPHAVGMMVGVLVQMPDHAADGDLSHIPASTVERWACWHGKAGAFDKQFRLILCTGNTVSQWEKHNGAAIREAARNAKNAKSYRERQRSRTGDVHADAHGDVTEYETRRDETGRDGFAVAVPCDSKKQLARGRSTQNYARGSDPRGIAAIGSDLMAQLHAKRGAA